MSENDLPLNIRNKRIQNMRLRGNVGILRLSDTGQTDSTKIAITLLKRARFRVTHMISVKNLEIEGPLTYMLNHPTIHIIICIGGTGVSNTDITIETVKPLFQKELIGFGELFRYLTYIKWNHLKHKIGIMSMSTRTTAGVANNKLLFAIPGSPDATELAIKEIIIPGSPTLLGQLRKNKIKN